MTFVRRYGFAVFAIVAATFVQWEVWKYIPPSPTLFFFPAVVLVAWKEGLGAALLSVVLATLSIAYFFLDPPMSFAVGDPRDQMDLLLFASTAGIVCFLVARTRSLERRFRLMFRELPVGIVWTEGAEGRITQANAPARRLLGMPQTGGTFPKVFAPGGAEIPPHERPRVRAFAGERVSAEVEVEVGDGKRIPLLESAVPLRSGGGKIDGTLVALQDISALKEVEVLRKQWNTLVAHDLRSPLHVILMSAAAMRAAGTESPHVDRIERATRRLDRIVRDLLDASRLEVKELPLVKTEVDLVSVVKECVAEHDEAPIEVKVRGSVPPISADRDRLEQVIENLLSNAVKYRARDTSIGVEVAAMDAAVEVSVTNRGPGIAEAERAVIFDRFRRVGDRKKPGVGVGLYIARGLVEAHQGRIECESVPNATTTFRVVLPLGA